MGPLYITACASSSSVSREQLSHSSSTTTIVSSCVCVAYVCVCVSVSVFLWHSHTNIPHFLFAFASESLPVSSLSSSALHWKETGRSTLTPTFTVRSQRCSSSTLVSVFFPPTTPLNCIWTVFAAPPRARVSLFIHWNNDDVSNIQTWSNIAPFNSHSPHAVTTSQDFAPRSPITGEWHIKVTLITTL